MLTGGATSGHEPGRRWYWALECCCWPACSTCVFFDPYDFALGSGLLPALLVLVRLKQIVQAPGPLSRTDELSLLGLASVAIVDATGLLRAETARVWLFLQPFVVLPAAAALVRWPLSHRAALFALQWLVVVVFKARMAFVNP